MIKNNIKICLIILGLSPITIVTAQDDKELPSGKVEVISSFEAKLDKAVKLPLNGPLKEEKVSPKSYTYEISSLSRDKKPPIKYEVPEIRPLAMKKEKLPDSYNGFLKLGVNVPLGAYIDGGYFLTNAESYFIDISGNHYSIFQSPRDQQLYNETNLRGTGTVYLKNGLAINGLAGFNLNNYRLYGGYEPVDTTFAEDASKRNYKNFEGGIKLYNSQKNKIDLDYHAGLDLYRYGNNENTNENKLGIDIGATKWLAEKHAITVDITNALYRYSDTTVINFNKFNVKPSFSFHGEIFKLKVGANFVNSTGGFVFFPDIEANLNLAGPAIMVFAGAGGDLYEQSFKRISTYNPFLESHYGGPFNTKYYDFYGGLSGGIRNISYRLQAGYKPQKDYPLFIQSTVDIRQFDVVVDDVNIFYFGGDLSAKFFDKLQTSLNFLGQLGEARHYSKVFGLVPFSLGFNAAYLALEDKLRLKADLNFASGSFYRNQFLSEGTLPPMFDLSLGAEYFFTEKFGAFLNVNNLASVKYQRWYKYPTYGINLAGGISLRF
jgi:hypothetical protein